MRVASKRAASRIGALSNWPGACGLSEISVTRKRPKSAGTSGKLASMAEVSGPSAVLDESVSMPSSKRLIRATYTFSLFRRLYCHVVSLTNSSVTANKPTRKTVAPPSGIELRVAIYDRILKAVLEHRLPPGRRLVEGRLAKLFDTSRAQVREVLARLADQGLVTTVPNRGAFIASPTADETREVFETRRLIAHRDTEAVDRLRALVEDEERARKLQDRPVMVRLSGEFHIRLAEYAGNRMLARSMRGPATLTCLAIFLYDAWHATACREDEHDALLNVIARRRADAQTSEPRRGLARLGDPAR